MVNIFQTCTTYTWHFQQNLVLLEALSLNQPLISHWPKSFLSLMDRLTMSCVTQITTTSKTCSRLDLQETFQQTFMKHSVLSWIRCLQISQHHNWPYRRRTGLEGPWGALRPQTVDFLMCCKVWCKAVKDRSREDVERMCSLFYLSSKMRA